MGSSSSNSNSSSSRCQVAGCTESHSRHYCKVCKNANSDHFSSKCPLNSQVTLTSTSKKCKVDQCMENHSSHYCKICKDTNSSHFSVNCPQNRSKINVRCNVPGCHEEHEKHHCRFCQSSDSNHFAIDCPNTLELYHATRVTNLEMDNGIGEIGLVPFGSNNRFGKGIYFAEFQYVRDISQNLFGDEGVILKCRVYLGKCKDFKNDTDYAGDWSKYYDSCTAIHPPWFNDTTASEFREWVIKDSKQCKIYSITYKGKEFRMTTYQNDKEILENLRKSAAN